MRVNKIINDSKVNGPGKRYTIWVQGCSIQCKGCSNTDTWDFDKGKEISPKKLVEDLEKEKVDGITITGGEPLDQYKKVIKFLKLVFSSYDIFLTTGYTLKEIEQSALKEILDYTDILVTGRFNEALIDETNTWRGSLNQRISFLTKRSKKFEKYIPKHGVEIKIDKRTGNRIYSGFNIPTNLIKSK